MNRLLAPNPLSFKLPLVRIQPTLVKALLLSQLFGVIWWLAAYYLSVKMHVPAWYDQQADFLTVFERWHSPYVNPRFVYVPWTVIPLLPFHFFSLYSATLVQTCLYFGLLTLVIFRFGGGLTATLLALTSFIALDSTIELNIEWLTCLGLLVPPALSGPFLLIRPQDALGIWFTFNRKVLVRAIIVCLAVLLISLFVWGLWPLQMSQPQQSISSLQQQINLAPSHFLSYPISAAIGLVLAWRAVRRRDPVFAILAWLFFVPYITFYSLLLHFAVLAIRFPRFALLISGLIWIIYGRIVLIVITS